MPQYHVVWDIIVNDESTIHAAMMALEKVKREGISIATVKEEPKDEEEHSKS